MSTAEQREKYYGTVRKPMSEQQSPTGNLERIPEYSEDIYPYATFHLPDEENLSGNPMLMSRYSGSSNAGTMPMSANLYNSRNSMSSVKEVRNVVARHTVHTTFFPLYIHIHILKCYQLLLPALQSQYIHRMNE